MSPRPVVIVSNRGPLSFTVDDDGALVARRGAGGLVSGLAPLVTDTDAVWIAAAISDGDREAATRGVVEADGFKVRLLSIDPDTYRAAYDVVCNATLWFLHHGLFDLARRPRFDTRFREAWDGLPEGEPGLRRRRWPSPRRRAPRCWCRTTTSPCSARSSSSAGPTCASSTSATPRSPPPTRGGCCPPTWAGSCWRAWPPTTHADSTPSAGPTPSPACCAEQLGQSPPTFVAPLAPDAADIGRVAAGDACGRALDGLDTDGRRPGAGGPRRPHRAVEEHPPGLPGLRGPARAVPRMARAGHLRGLRVPLAGGLPEYLAYRQEVEATVRRINERWSTPGWTPILFDPSDDFPLSVAALRRADVFLINPIRDGLNLVAEEGPLVNDRDAVLLLSPEAGVWDQLAGAARPVHPYDISGTADALAAALAATPEERAIEAAEVRRRAAARTPEDWLADQLSAAD